MLYILIAYNITIIFIYNIFQYSRERRLRERRIYLFIEKERLKFTQILYVNTLA